MDDPTPKTPARPASYSTAFVAERLGVSVPTVQRWVDAGHLKAWKTLGGHRRIDAGSAERLFAAQGFAGGPADPAPRPASVLVVEDNPDDRDLLVALCEAALPGARLRLAENGFVGLLCIGQETPDVLVTDIVMPRMDGIEMLHQLAGRSGSWPRVVIAASSEPADRLFRARPLPPDAVFVAKPFDAPAFIQLLRGAMLTADGDAPRPAAA